VHSVGLGCPGDTAAMGVMGPLIGHRCDDGGDLYSRESILVGCAVMATPEALSVWRAAGCAVFGFGLV